jgi:biotin carboxyl carrier protein
MKLEAQSGESTCTFEFDERGGTFRLSLDGREIEGDVLQPEPGVFSFMVGHRVVEFHVSKLPGIETRRVVTVAGTTDVRIIDRKHRSPGDEAEGDGQQIMLAPMPGKVVAILAAVGDTVERGQGVLVVEAMKMQNEVKAARDGVVSEIKVSAGDTVSAGQVLARLE